MRKFFTQNNTVTHNTTKYQCHSEGASATEESHNIFCSTLEGEPKSSISKGVKKTEFQYHRIKTLKNFIFMS